MLKVYSVYDCKVGAYMNPIYLRSLGEAIRCFQATVNTADHQFAKSPGDYTLFELGSWNEIDAKFDLHKSPVSCGVAIEFLNPDS